MKHCPKCDKDLDESLFKKKANGTYQAYCIECKKIVDREYQARKRAEKLAQTKTETVEPKTEPGPVKEEPEVIEDHVSEPVKDYQKVIYYPCDDWISIEDRLPDHAGIYLITQLGSNTYEQSMKGIKVPVVSESTFISGKFFNGNVQAWRPVPEPYKHVKPTVTPAPWYQRQPLGYKDRNDVEIHEGDILNIRTVTRFDYRNSSPVVFKWDPRGLSVSSSKIHEIGGDTLHGVPNAVLSQCEIIGSIYELEKVKETVLTDTYFSNTVDLDKAIEWVNKEVANGKRK